MFVKLLYLITGHMLEHIMSLVFLNGTCVILKSTYVFIPVAVSV